jgi:hypothetical protein
MDRLGVVLRLFEDSREFLDPAPIKLFEPDEDARLKSLEDHAINPLQLPVGARVFDRRPVVPDTVSVGELQELLACEVGLVVYDDGVWHTKSVDDVLEELDGLLGVGFGDGFRLNPHSELVHHDEHMSETKPS